jgi:hypothetical protein
MSKCEKGKRYLAGWEEFADGMVNINQGIEL